MFYSITFAPAFERERRTNMMKEVTWGKGMRLEVLSKIPTATATRKKNFSIFLLKNLAVKKKSLPLQPQSKRKRKFFERFTYQQVVQVL